MKSMQFAVVFLLLLVDYHRIESIRVGLIQNVSLVGQNGLEKNVTSCDECVCLLITNNFASFNCYALNITCEMFSSYNTTTDYRVENNLNSVFFFLELPSIFPTTSGIATETTTVHSAATTATTSTATTSTRTTTMSTVTTSTGTTTTSTATTSTRTTTTSTATTSTASTTTTTRTTTTTTVTIPVPCSATAAFTGTSTLKTLSNGAMDWTCFSFNWTASAISHTINFKFRQDSNDWFMDGVSVFDRSANQLIVNGGFEGGTYGTAKRYPIANNWTWSGSSCSCCVGVVSTTSKDGSHSWDDGCNGATDNLSQSFSTIIGNMYFISWWLKNTGSGTASFNAAIT